MAGYVRLLVKNPKAPLLPDGLAVAATGTNTDNATLTKTLAALTGTLTGVGM